MAKHDSLAVDFFLLAHDPFDDGRLVVSPEILGYGLVGGKIADLILGRQLRIDGDRVVAVDLAAPGDAVDRFVIDAVRSQKTAHSVRSWIEPLQDDLYESVGDHLVGSGVLRREQGTRRIGRGRQPDRFPAVDLLVACAPQHRLEQMLHTPKDLTLAAGALVALLSVLGLDRAFAPRLDRTTLREIVAEIEENLPTDLRKVHDAVRTVSGEASLRLR